MTDERRGPRAALLLAVLVFGGCNTVGRLVVQESPHDGYASMLRRSGVDRTALGQDWLRAGAAALAAPLHASLPFTETGYLPSDSATAVAYRLDLQRGRRLTLDVTFQSAEPARLFLDLFELPLGHAPRRVAALEAEQTSLVYEVERDGTYAVRLQPELLRGGNYVLAQRTLASLTFPVVGLTSRHVQSLFGAARDAGARDHQGIDIFAPRGTAVVAVADGTAYPDMNGLGGNVVWLRAGLGGPTFYYAHLDRWEIGGNARVRVGDVLGYVGNTGNARTTAPHLHFGIYDGGAINPLPFLEPDDAIPAMITPPRELGALMRVVVARATLRAGPGTHHPELTRLARHVPLRVHGVAADWFRVSTPDATTGYMSSRLVGSLAPPLGVAHLSPGTIVRERPDETSPVMEIVDATGHAETLAAFGEHDLLRLASGRTGWVHARQD